MNPALYNEFNPAVDRLSQNVSTRSPNVEFVRGTRGRGGRNISSIVHRKVVRGGVRFEGGGDRFERGSYNSCGDRGEKGHFEEREL